MDALVLKAAVLAATFVTMSSLAASARPMSSAMSCGAVRNMVARSGSIVMNFTPTTYDRVVSNRAYCLSTEYLEPIYVPTVDARQCLAGYTCREGDTGRW